MTFTPQTPITVGFYAWRQSKDDDDVILLAVAQSEGILIEESTGYDIATYYAGGLWCRLVEADEVVKAHCEGYEARAWATWLSAFDASRAKRIVEGRE